MSGRFSGEILDTFSHYLETTQVEKGDSGIQTFAKKLADQLHVGQLTQEEARTRELPEGWAEKAKAVYIAALAGEVIFPAGSRRLVENDVVAVNAVRSMEYVSAVLKGTGRTIREMQYLTRIGGQAIEDAGVLRGTIKPISQTMPLYQHFKLISAPKIASLNSAYAQPKVASRPQNH